MEAIFNQKYNTCVKEVLMKLEKDLVYADNNLKYEVL